MIRLNSAVLAAAITLAPAAFAADAGQVGSPPEIDERVEIDRQRPADGEPSGQMVETESDAAGAGVSDPRCAGRARFRPPAQGEEGEPR